MNMGQTIHSPVFAPFGFGAPLSRSGENPTVPLSQIDSDSELYEAFAGPKTTSGIRISRKKALGYSAVWRAVNLISSKIAALPLKVFKAVGKGHEVDTAHPAYSLLGRKPNEYMTAMTLKETLQSHCLLRGNGYGYVYRDRDGRPTEIYPLNPELTWPVRRGGVLWYVTEVEIGENTFETRRLRAEDVIHLRGLGWDGLVGYDVITILRETLGKAIATREHGTRFFANDARPSIALEFPNGMKDTAVENVINRWSRMNQGLENKHKTGFLREGVKLHTYSTNARDSQLTENLTFDAMDIANVFGLPPRKLGLDQGGGYNSLFEENQSVHDDTLDPWCRRWEEACDLILLTEEQQKSESHCCKFVRNAVMRSNPDQRSAFYTKMIENGLMCGDEARALEDLNPLPDGKGQIFYMKPGMVPVGTEPAAAPPEPTQDLANSVRALLRETAGRMARRLATQSQRKTDLEEQFEPVSEALEGACGVVRAISRNSGADPLAIARKMVDFAKSHGEIGPDFEQKCVEMVMKTVFPEV